MDTSKQRKPRRAGCALAVVVVVGAIVGLGLWFGRMNEASRTPCERYARTVTRELDSCHSGISRDESEHVATCKARLEPTPACLERIEALSCDDLETAVSMATACRAQP